MGKIEKVVVLSVLFLMVVIFVVTTTGSPETPTERDKVAQVDSSQGRLRSNDLGNLGRTGGATADRRSAKAATERNSEGRSARSDQAKTRKKPEGLLSGGVTTAAAQRKQAEARRRAEQAKRDQNQATARGLRKPDLQVAKKPALDPSWTLVRLDGLTDTINPAYKIYKCSKGDTFESVAKRFYGDKGHAHFLRRNNEGVRSLSAGRELLMPCVNETPLANTYKVLEGDSLWSIAKDQYNAGHRWNEIYDANRHVLRSPDDLRQGLELTIP